MGCSLKPDLLMAPPCAIVRFRLPARRERPGGGRSRRLASSLAGNKPRPARANSRPSAHAFGMFKLAPLPAAPVAPASFGHHAVPVSPPEALGQYARRLLRASPGPAHNSPHPADSIAPPHLHAGRAPANFSTDLPSCKSIVNSAAECGCHQKADPECGRVDRQSRIFSLRPAQARPIKAPSMMPAAAGRCGSSGPGWRA